MEMERLILKCVVAALALLAAGAANAWTIEGNFRTPVANANGHPTRIEVRGLSDPAVKESCRKADSVRRQP